MEALGLAAATITGGGLGYVFGGWIDGPVDNSLPIEEKRTEVVALEFEQAAHEAGREAMRAYVGEECYAAIFPFTINQLGADAPIEDVLEGVEVRGSCSGDSEELAAQIESLRRSFASESKVRDIELPEAKGQLEDLEAEDGEESPMWNIVMALAGGSAGLHFSNRLIWRRRDLQQASERS